MDLVFSGENSTLFDAGGRNSNRPMREMLLNEETADGLVFRFLRTEHNAGDQEFVTTRHKHAFQQIRWAESGSVNFGPDEDIEVGDVAYFPRGAYYGPQRKDGGVEMLLQFGFGDEMPGGKDSIRVLREGMERLAKRGRVESRVFIDVDPETGEERRRDAAELVAEEYLQRPTTVHPPAYSSPVLMHIGAFRPEQAAPGVLVRRLGRFYDHTGPNGDVRISAIQLSEAGQYRLSADRPQMAWTKSPGLQIEGRVCPERTCLFSPHGEEVVISAEQPVDVHVVDFPYFG